jgi:hypothetical protein
MKLTVALDAGRIVVGELSTLGLELSSSLERLVKGICEP